MKTQSYINKENKVSEFLYNYFCTEEYVVISEAPGYALSRKCKSGWYSSESFTGLSFYHNLSNGMKIRVSNHNRPDKAMIYKRPYREIILHQDIDLLKIKGILDKLI